MVQVTDKLPDDVASLQKMLIAERSTSERLRKQLEVVSSRQRRTKSRSKEKSSLRNIYATTRLTNTDTLVRTVFTFNQYGCSRSPEYAFMPYGYIKHVLTELPAAKTLEDVKALISFNLQPDERKVA